MRKKMKLTLLGTAAALGMSASLASADSHYGPMPDENGRFPDA